MKTIHLIIFVVTFGFTLMNSKNVNASSYEAQRYMTQFKVLDADAQSKRLEGRLRANIAFNKALAKEKIEINVEQDMAFIKGEVSSLLLVEIVKQEALVLFPEHQINMQLNVKAKNQIVGSQGITAKLAGLFNLTR